MNKLLVVLLAVCLVSVHAFVKRDAPARDTKDALETFQKDVKEKVDEISKFMGETFDADKIKDTMNEVLKKLNDALNPQGTAKPTPA